jgi:hypothetical protein
MRSSRSGRMKRGAVLLYTGYLLIGEPGFIVTRTSLRLPPLSWREARV